MGQPRSPRSTQLLLVSIVIIGLAIRFAFASVYVGFDDRHYIEGAYLLSVGQQSGTPQHFETRNGMVGSTAALFAAFGVNAATAVAIPLACSALGFLALFLLGRDLFDETTALVAAALLAVFPLDVIFATTTSPTTPIGLFAGAAILLFALGERTRDTRTFAVAGASLGIAASFSETPLLVLIAYAVYAVTLGRPSRAHLAALAALVATLVIDATVSAAIYGDPLVRFAALSRQATVRGVNVDVAEAGWTIDWLSHPLLRIASEQELGLYLLLGLPLAVWCLIKSRDRTERTLALFVAVLFVWISYGTISPFTYAPLDRLPRYLSLFQLPLVLLLALWLRRLAPTTSIAVGVAILVSSLACVVLDGSRARADGYRHAHAVIAEANPARVVVDPEASAPFLFFSGYRPRMPVAVLRPDGTSYRTVGVLGYAEAGSDHRALSQPGTYVIAGSPAVRKWLALQPGLVLLQRIPPPDTLYRRLLNSETFLELLAMVRSRYRIQGLEYAAGEGEVIEVFEIRY